MGVLPKITALGPHMALCSVFGSSTLNRGVRQQPHLEANFEFQKGISPHFCPTLGSKTRSSHHISVDHGLMGCYQRLLHRQVMAIFVLNDPLVYHTSQIVLQKATPFSLTQGNTARLVVALLRSEVLLMLYLYAGQPVRAVDLLGCDRCGVGSRMLLAT